jgi:hypothetical protein
MHFFARTVVATAALALVGGVAATGTTASAHDVRVRVGTPKPYYYQQRPVYKYRSAKRYYYQPPVRRYYVAPKRNYLNCRWVPNRGRVCW